MALICNFFNMHSSGGLPRSALQSTVWAKLRCSGQRPSRTRHSFFGTQCKPSRPKSEHGSLMLSSFQQCSKIADKNEVSHRTARSLLTELATSLITAGGISSRNNTFLYYVPTWVTLLTNNKHFVSPAREILPPSPPLCVSLCVLVL